MCNDLQARRHDRAVHLLAMRRLRAALRRGGRLTQELVRTPLRTVIYHTARVGEDIADVSVGELWGVQ